MSAEARTDGGPPGILCEGCQQPQLQRRQDFQFGTAILDSVECFLLTIGKNGVDLTWSVFEVDGARSARPVSRFLVSGDEPDPHVLLLCFSLDDACAEDLIRFAHRAVRPLIPVGALLRVLRQRPAVRGCPVITCPAKLYHRKLCRKTTLCVSSRQSSSTF